MTIKELESCHNENTSLSINWNARYCLVFYIFWDLTVELFISNIGENLQFWVSTILTFEFVCVARMIQCVALNTHIFTNFAIFFCTETVLNLCDTLCWQSIVDIAVLQHSWRLMSIQKRKSCIAWITDSSSKLRELQSSAEISRNWILAIEGLHSCAQKNMMPYWSHAQCPMNRLHIFPTLSMIQVTNRFNFFQQTFAKCDVHLRHSWSFRCTDELLWQIIHNTFSQTYLSIEDWTKLKIIVLWEWFPRENSFYTLRATYF